MTYRDFDGDLQVPRIRIFRTVEWLERVKLTRTPYRVIGSIGYATDVDLHLQNSPQGIENQWNYDEAAGRTILVEVDAI